MTAPEDHSQCRGYVVGLFAARGIEVHVAAVPPIVQSPYEEAPFICPHRVAYWAEPTTDQIARWAAEGVR